MTFNYQRDLGHPGRHPFTRGIHESMYRGRSWTMRQYAGFGTAEETNKRFHYLLREGQTGLSIAFDLPTQMGYDSDHPMARGEVGRVGVTIDTLEDMETLLDGIPLEEVSTSMTINATAPILLALYLVVAERRGISWTRLRGTVQNDILKEYIARGTFIYPIEPSIRLVTDLVNFCRREVPKWNAISVSGYHMREAGCTAVQEVAFTLLNGKTYLDAALKSGLGIDEIAPHVSFFFGVHNDFLEEVAKFRAARRLWSRLVQDRFAPRDEASCKLRFHAQTAGSSLIAQQPKNNIVRVTLQALAAVLGGAQSLHTNSYDEALSLPTEEAALLALRTQQVIAFESGVTNTVDPCGGSYVIEELTDRIEGKARELIEKIEREGGMIRAIQNGGIQREIQEAAFLYHKEVEGKKRIVVGVNEFAVKEEEPIRLHRVGPQLEEKRKRALERFRKNRKSDSARQALERLKGVARGRENLIPSILDAVRSQASLGEISEALRGVFGVYQERVVL